MPTPNDYCSKCEQWVGPGLNQHRCLGKPIFVNGRTFKDWQLEVDRLVEEESNLSIDDLPDWTYWDAWHEGMSPQQASVEVLVSAGYPGFREGE